jgi:hypothetical protein
VKVTFEINKFSNLNDVLDKETSYIKYKNEFKFKAKMNSKNYYNYFISTNYMVI